MLETPDTGHLIRMKRFPNIWCAGCGNGIVMQSLLHAIMKLNLKQDDVCVVSGIGCSSRLAGYVDFNTLHTAHGRAIAFATGVKIAKPRLHVIVVTGDGDATAIGCSHFVHAARRNLDLTVVLINNYIYGMTGGQASPTTPLGDKGTTAPYGNAEPSFNISGLAQSAGAGFVAKTTTYHVNQCTQFIEKAIQSPGFSLVEVITGCPTYYGRFNKLAKPSDLLKWQKEASVPISKAKTMTEDELKGKIITGIYCETPKPEWRAEYQKLINSFKENKA